MKQTIEFDKDVNEIEVTLPDGLNIKWEHNEVAGNFNISFSAPIIELRSSATPNKEIAVNVFYGKISKSSQLHGEIPQEVLLKSVEELPISVNPATGLKTRIHSILHSANIKTIGDLLKHKEDMRQFRNCGYKSIVAIEEALEDMGYHVQFNKKY